MVDLLQVDKVQYVWNEETGEKLPLCYLYFCKYCLDIRSADNLHHEVDSHFCSQSLDGVPSTEAVLKKNKSTNCWQCPACPHTLSTRATTLLIPDPDDPSKQLSKKSYYQTCSFCRWISRDVGIEDKISASGGWIEKEPPNLGRINEVMEYYKYIAQKEAQDNKNAKKRGYKTLTMQLQQRYGSTKTGRKPHPASPMNAVMSRMKEHQELKEVKIVPSSTFSIQDVEPLSEDTYSKQIDFTKVSSIEKRISQPDHQPIRVEDYYPKRSTMFIKRSLRCKQCEHNLIKPEYHPSSIKFKMQLVAIHYIPEIRFHSQPELKPGERVRVTFVVINRTDNTSHVTLTPLVAENLNYPIGNSKCDLPQQELVVAPFQEAEFDAVEDPNKSKDDPDVIAFRQANKLGFYIWCTPDPDLKEGDDVWISFSMKYDHHSNVAFLLQQAIDSSAEPEINWLCHRVFVNLGKI
uniref:dynactin subunit 4-like n=1 Tax=Styela clava TaxID=7725 RepID=UPI00193A55D9|nr:dynactin subunit 4-like [Styela clava]